jgi:hypothetical protein
MKTTKKRPGLNEAFKQFQRLPEWPIERAHEANQLSEKADEANRRTLQPSSGGRSSPLRKFQLLVQDVQTGKIK